MKDQLQVLFEHILKTGVKKSDRTGVGTISTFGYQCRFDLKEGFPIVTTKKTAFKAAVTELLWMIGGWMKDPAYAGIQRTNIKYLLDNNCKIWTEWPYKAYKKYVDSIPAGSTIPGNYLAANEEAGKSGPWPYRSFTQNEFEKQIMRDHDFAVKFGDLGPVYQKQWRDFEGKNVVCFPPEKRNAVDQLMVMIERLKTNPDDRRNLTSFWNPTELNEMMVSGLPPCHLLHQVWTRELSIKERYCHLRKFKYNAKFELLPESTKQDEMNYYDSINVPTRALSLQMYQRSSDCFLGVPFDWVFYSLLTHMLAEQTNMVVDEFIWTSGDTHLYLNSLDAVDEVMKREPYAYPKLIINSKPDNIEDYKIEDFKLDDYQCHPAIKVEVAV